MGRAQRARLPDRAALDLRPRTVWIPQLVGTPFAAHRRMRGAGVDVAGRAFRSAAPRPVPRLIATWPVASYFVLTIAISWGLGLLIVGPASLPLTWERFERLGPALYAAIISGPGLASVTMTWLLDGRAGIRALFARLRRWRIGARWYAHALVPVAVVAAVSSTMALVAPTFAPTLPGAELLATIPTIIALSFIVAFFEETGWSGFAMPHLRTRHGAVATALIIGVVWGTWHFPLFWQPDSFAGPLPLAILLLQLFSWLPGFRILMVWLQDRTGSLVLPWLMHVGLIAVQLLFQPSEVGRGGLLASLIMPATVWTMVAVVAIVRRR